MYFLELSILCLEIEGGKSQPECFPMVPKAKAKNKKKEHASSHSCGPSHHSQEWMAKGTQRAS